MDLLANRIKIMTQHLLSYDEIQPLLLPVVINSKNTPSDNRYHFCSKQALSLLIKHGSLDLLTHQLFALYENNNYLYIAIPDDQARSTILSLQPKACKQLVGINTQLSFHQHQVKSLTRQWLFHHHNLACEQGKSEAGVQLLECVLQQAVSLKASDIHIEPKKKETRVRLRCDGLLTLLTALPIARHSTLINQLKILADCDITEHRLAQDGHFTLSDDSNNIDTRLNICPTIFGEKAVIRLQDNNHAITELNRLGLDTRSFQLLKKSAHQSQGLILVTGPTGSGKTMTLYSLLAQMKQMEKNIVTIENPVEVPFEGLTQTNTFEAIGLDYQAILKSLLRQDPDVIMIGEIRDIETATIALRAAQTGHLVLATLHTNSAAKSINRLMDMGIARYHLASCLHLVVAQRLVRKLCIHCKKQHAYCVHCHEGYQGRMGVFEVMTMTDELTAALNDHTCHSHDFERIAVDAGMQTLRMATAMLVKENITDECELHRVLGN